MRPSICPALRLGAVSVLACTIFGTAYAQTNVMFIFDASGSMVTKAGTDTRIGAAKKAMEITLKEMPKDARLGLMMYGHRRANDCTDIELVSPIGADDAAKISRTIQAVQPKGETPIAEALRQAARSFVAFKGQSNSIVLVTDGIEECKGDPCAAAKELKAAGLDLKVHIVGFTLNDAQRKAIQCVPDTTGGKYFEAKDPSGLDRALGEVRQQTAQAPPPPAAPAPPPRTNLLAPASGGEVVVSSQPEWERTVDQKLDQIYWFKSGAEAVYGFKSGSAAKFDTFAVYLPGNDKNNVKDLELFAGDDGPTGAFRPLGVVSAVNAKVRDGWQEFKIPETTAKFFKVKVASSQGGGDSYLYELRLYGTPAP